jgi:hypothetical protein
VRNPRAADDRIIDDHRQRRRKIERYQGPFRFAGKLDNLTQGRARSAERRRLRTAHQEILDETKADCHPDRLCFIGWRHSGLACRLCNACERERAVQVLYDTLLSTMKNGRALGQSGRFTRLQPIVRKTFDLVTMSRLSVGPFWAMLTET